MLLTEREQQIISSLKEVPDKTIQFQHIIYLYFVLEIAFLFIMQNENISGLNIFEYTFLYTGYAGDTTSLFEDEKSVIEFMKTFDIFSIFWT